MHYRFALIRCACLAVLLAVGLSGCRLHEKPARRADFIGRILPPLGCCTEDNMMLVPGRKGAKAGVSPADIPPPQIQVPKIKQPPVPPVVPPSPADPAPNNPSLTEFNLLFEGDFPSSQPASEIQLCAASTFDPLAEQPPVNEAAFPEVVPPGRLSDDLLGIDNPSDACRLSLEQAVITALQQNPQLAIAQADIAKAAAGKKIAFSAFLPQLGVVDSLNSADISVMNTSSPELSPFFPATLVQCIQSSRTGNAMDRLGFWAAGRQVSPGRHFRTNCPTPLPARPPNDCLRRDGSLLSRTFGLFDRGHRPKYIAPC